MKFSATDIAAMLKATGQQVNITLNGSVVNTPYAKFRRESRVESPYESERVLLRPQITLATSDLEDVTRLHTITVEGVTYKIFGDFTDLDNGMSVVELAK